MLQQLAAIGYEPGPDISPEAYGGFLKAETAKWKQLVQETAVGIE